jgi:hypothetical protein
MSPPANERTEIDMADRGAGPMNRRVVSAGVTGGNQPQEKHHEDQN